MPYLSGQLRQQVIDRAQYRCEYCQIPDNLSFYPHEIDHIIALKHQGSTTFDNLAYACWRCNRHKGSDLGSFDPETGQFSFFYHPRKQTWTEHFCYYTYQILGLTPAGRTTIRCFQLNTPERLTERQRIPANPNTSLPNTSPP